MAAVTGDRMSRKLGDQVRRWASCAGIDPGIMPSDVALASAFRGAKDPCRPAADPRAIDDWESRHGFALPRGLRAWLEISNGFYLRGPLIHPLSAIGPMVPFARFPELFVQPESWFELGNPNVETVCIDLAYLWPSGGQPIFTSGDDTTQSPPRVIAPSFEDWFIAMLASGGREYWFDPGFRDLGHPWAAHRTHAPVPTLPARLRPLVRKASKLLTPGVDDRSVATALGISRGDVELLCRHIQHAP
ncbi:MAG: SMI1/KNR4 family protein [Isosphaeraceae bacterium]